MTHAVATSTPRPDLLKRVFTNITVSLPELAAIVACFEAMGRPVTIRANTFKLWDIQELRAVVAEEEVVDHLAISSCSSEDGELRLHYDLGYILVEATEESWRPAFSRITALLAAKPKNGTAHCLIAVESTAVPQGGENAPLSGRARVSDVLAIAPLSRRAGAITRASVAAKLSKWVSRTTMDLRISALRIRLLGPTLTWQRLLGAAAGACVVALLVRQGHHWASTMHVVSWSLLSAAIALAWAAWRVSRPVFSRE